MNVRKVSMACAVSLTLMNVCLSRVEMEQCVRIMSTLTRVLAKRASVVSTVLTMIMIVLTGTVL